MIFLRISSKSEKKIEAIAELLLKEKLAMDLNIKRNIERLELVGEKVISSYITLITCKTKGLLFPYIDKRLNELYKDNLPEIYSLPIVHMDWEQAEKLTNEVKPA